MSTAILWFRNDLRLADNPALNAASRHERLLCVYIHAPEEAGDWAPGAASRWWLHHSLQALDARLRRLGNRLHHHHGPSADRLGALAAATGAEAIYWNRVYDPALIERDRDIKTDLREAGLTAESFNANLIYEPWSLTRDRGQPYKVFTPFWKALQKAGLRDDASPAPDALPPPPASVPAALALEQLALLPKIRWDGGLAERWQPGETGAGQRLAGFLRDHLQDYTEARDLPGNDGVSALSPHLHFGEIGPRQIIHAVRRQQRAESIQAGEAYLRQLAWRDFGHHLLFHFPQTVDTALNPRFEQFPWREGDDPVLQAWQQGRTGVPLVDAGMRELWQSGWMHNRARMVVGSWLTKHLLWHWRDGARWFWDTLVDADLANNTLGWQWIAGCGADAAPYFRVFNPVRQGERFDADGRYVRRWLPELARLPDAWLHQPWAAPTAVLDAARMTLGTDYPRPQITPADGRDRALQAYETIKGGRYNA